MYVLWAGVLAPVNPGVDQIQENRIIVSDRRRGPDL